MEDDAARMDRGRRLARRRMADISFAVLVFVAISVVSSLLWSSARAEIAAALSVASAVLIGMFTFFTLIIAGYLGLSTTEKLWDCKSQDDQQSSKPVVRVPAGSAKKEPWEGEGGK